ncbi:MAG: (E)-4-hydroxy-3-methylbut-2-enyl-diphosphate synthase [Lentimicrobium sp.]|jgi:(E)-4-hydroxy-3-methylbut-2-enyl-diphosphate synthase|nr:(E)-4-hydroxy-3-methylbut-2-enyl-diphosphate synthase [Lentimicrobium sp.]
MQYISREIHVGNLTMGAGHPIRLQSMTSTPTMDTEATVAQAIRMIESGSELVRITAQGPKEARHLQVIKDELKKRGFAVPLIADIHFSPAAAEIAAGIVEKVRINPGNYTDRPNASKVEWTDAEYQAELDSIAEKLEPLLQICLTHGTAIRIGVNHGSLSQRIVSRYGDTPEGMVQSALEFTRICVARGFHNLVLSMKSSNVRVMVSAYRLLAEKLTNEGLNYPLHLGVTEAGDGEDGRLKSIAGTGALLARGIGDTLRVSLTEPPENELPVAKAIVEQFQSADESGKINRSVRNDFNIVEEVVANRKTTASGLIGGKNQPVLLIEKHGHYYMADEHGGLELLSHPVISIDQSVVFTSGPNLLPVNDDELQNKMPEILQLLSASPETVIIARTGSDAARKLVKTLAENTLTNPLIFHSPSVITSIDDMLLENGLNPGNLLIDGLGNGICMDGLPLNEVDVVRIGYGLLQATRMRISRTEFIACPSCGRTQYDIQTTLQQVKARTAHLKGLKIAVMGCIVNGPGEMADADYGYVGAGNGKVSLYKGKNPVKRSIPEATAVEALVELIKENGDWRGGD